MKTVVWCLFDSGGGSYQLSIDKYFPDKFEAYAVGIDIEKKHNNFIHCDLGDISELFGERRLFDTLDKLPKPDIILASPPCFSGETLVTTSDGLKEIKDIKIGDMVMTHNNRYRRVVNFGGKLSKNARLIKVAGAKEITTTDEHPFYVVQRLRKWENNTRRWTYSLTEPTWKEAKNLQPQKDYIVFPVNKESVDTYGLTDDELYLLGRYVSDGWVDKRDSFTTIIALGKGKESDLNHIRQFNIRFNQGKTVLKASINSERLRMLVDTCGHGAINKVIPQFIVDLPKEKLEIFYNGLIAGDGYKTPNGGYNDKCIEYGLNTVSEKLIYGLGQVVHKLFNVHYNVSTTKRDKMTIEGREVNCSDLHMIKWKIGNVPQKQWYCDGSYIYAKVKSNNVETDYNNLVYNMEVEEDNTYCVYNVAVHNCESWSNASAMPGGNAAWLNTKAKPDFTLRSKKSLDEIGSKNISQKRYFWKTTFNRLNGEACAYNVIRIIEHYKPKHWVIENPQTSKLWRYYEDVCDFHGIKNVAHYCDYNENFSKKPTTFYSNVKLNLSTGQVKPVVFIGGNGHKKGKTRNGYNNRSAIPLELIKDILEQIEKIGT